MFVVLHVLSTVNVFLQLHNAIFKLTLFINVFVNAIIIFINGLSIK